MIAGDSLNREGKGEAANDQRRWNEFGEVEMVDEMDCSGGGGVRWLGVDGQKSKTKTN